VVPVPLHPGRLAARGYNQAALLARPVARELRARFSPLLLRRTRPTAPQAKLDAEARQLNVRGAFEAEPSHRLRAASVLLVDDVATTGATLADASRALRRAGAGSVQALVVALVAPPVGP